MINERGFVVAKNQRVIDKLTLNLERSLKPVEYFNDMELAAVPPGSVFIFDSECYRNFWYVSFKCVKTNKVVSFEQSQCDEININKLRWMLWRYCIVGFKSRTYDMPMITLAMKGATCNDLKEASDFLILKTTDEFGKDKSTSLFDFEKQFKVKVEQFNHIDLIEVAPLQGSLKLYAGRLHCDRMQDLPFPPDHILTEPEAAIVRPYCDNDLDNTKLLYLDLLPQLSLREEMGKEYGLDLRSKSDAQLAEAVINSELAKLTGKYPKKPTLEFGTVLKYDVPACIRFQSPELQAMLERVREASFELDGMGSPLWPKGLGVLEKAKNSSNGTWVLKVNVGQNVYKMGMGGLHSQEKSVTHLADLSTILEDDDFDSFYPYIIISQRLFPPHLGEAFLQVYEHIVKTRIHAKRQVAACKESGDIEGASRWKVIADSLKITINGSFGKLGNKYSTIYAPQLMLQVTITGQLILLMLIEMLELAGIQCISANTDGVISKFRPDQNETKRAVIKEIERITGFTTEATRYAGVYNRDVNNYIATKLKFDKKLDQWTNQIEECKVKGIYSERGSALNSVLSKNPETLICSDALQAFIQHGTPIEKTIKECKDIRRFIALKNVKGGGEKGGKFLGKVVRWYYPKNEAGFIAYVGSGNKVSKTDSARPLMDLPSEFPNDVNYDWYIRETKDMFYDVGLWQKPTTMPLFFQ